MFPRTAPGRSALAVAAPVLFAYWTLFLLHRYFAVNPVDFGAALRALGPSFPADRFSMANLAETYGRAARGHLAAAVFAAALAGLGRAAARFAGLPRAAAPGSLVLALGLGMAVAAPAWLGLGLAGLLDARLAMAAAVLGLALLWHDRRALVARATRPVETGASPRWIGAIFLGEAAVAAFLVAAVCLTPERFYDAQVYHLALPALFAMQHKVTALPNLLHASFPPAAVSLYQWLWLLGGEPAARAWRPWLFLALLRAVWALGAREGSRAAGLAGAGAFATCPLLMTNASQTTVDVEVAFAVLLACLALRASWRGPGRGAWLAAGGALAGLVAAMKYTAVFWAPGLLFLAAGGRGRSVRARATRLAVFAAVAALWIFPGLARNASAVGNPVYPYATALFPDGRQWDPARQRRFLAQQATSVVESRADYLRLPWLLTTGNNSETFIGPVFLLFAPLLLAGRPRAAGPRALALVAAASLAIWAAITHIHRFLLPTWGLLALLVALALEELGAARPRLRDAGLLLLAGLSGAGLAGVMTLWRSYLDPVNLIAGRESPAAYLDRKMHNGYRAATLAPLPPRARIAPVGETRALYWTRPVANHSVYDVQVFEEAVRASRDGAEAAKRLRQRGVTHLYFNDGETSRLKFRFAYPLLEFDDRQRGVIAGLWARWADSVWASPSHQSLYALRRAPAPARRVPPPAPLSFDPDAMRREFEGFATITWQGGGEIQVKKDVIR